ncbi:MAG: hypothetical protein R3C28_03980 [Pirellulaceae bacterium]
MLIGDPKLGSDEQKRFLPSRFDPNGNAIDSNGAICQTLACPSCHLRIPKPLLEITPTFFSIIGSPACGKTYFLASMIWRLRQMMPREFHINFTDADPQSNKILSEYEDQQFFNQDRDKVVKLAKTEEQGDLYDNVLLDNQPVMLPLPFMYSMRPTQKHPSFENARKVSRILTLYDNAGESFLPGKDTGQNRVTRHLAKSQSLLFLYDPTQDPRFREACARRSNDPQLSDNIVTSRQEILLHELADRVRRHVGLEQNQAYSRPLIVVVTKYDAWSSLLDDDALESPVIRRTNVPWTALDLDAIRERSERVKQLLWKFTPELVSKRRIVLFASLVRSCRPTGVAPERDPTTGNLGIRPSAIDPKWCEVPILWTVSQHCPGLIPFVDSQNGRSADPGSE